MKANSLGMFLIAVGLVMMIYTGFNYVTTENVVDIGSLQINKDTSHPIRWSPIIGLGLFIGGILIMIVGRKAMAR